MHCSSKLLTQSLHNTHTSADFWTQPTFSLKTFILHHDEKKITLKLFIAINLILTTQGDSALTEGAPEDRPHPTGAGI